MELGDRKVFNFALGGAVARLACSWKSSAGREAVIEATIHGTLGALTLQNLNGSFYELMVEHRQGTTAKLLRGPDRSWGGGAIHHWIAGLQQAQGYDVATEKLVDVARVIDRIYRR